jgi:hypothetical protein
MMMLKFRKSWIISTLLAASMVMALCSMAKGATDGWLITPEEAQMQIRDGSYADPVSAIEGYGPAIVVKRPKMLQQLSSPIDILVSFEPGMNGDIADMKTLKVTLVGWIDIDITGRLTKYISGTNLDVKQADLPGGDHRLRMSIKDVEGKVNERDVIIAVVKK